MAKIKKPTIVGFPVPETGVEPARLLGHTDLNRARLPIPPPGQYHIIKKSLIKGREFYLIPTPSRKE